MLVKRAGSRRTGGSRSPTAIPRGSSVVEQVVHTHQVEGAIPFPATNLQVSPRWDTSLPSCVEFGSTPTICSKQCVLHCAHHESNRSSSTIYLWVYCQPGRRPLSESGGRRFKSCHPDQFKPIQYDISVVLIPVSRGCGAEGEARQTVNLFSLSDLVRIRTSPPNLQSPQSFCRVAQLVERAAVNRVVVGSIPTSTARPL